MEKNKTRKYLKYAIGEIILVVIGILIALQINNWNEERKVFKKSKDYLTEILKDLETDTILFNYGIENISKHIKIEEWALSQTDYKPNQIDSLWDSFGGWYFDFSINDRTFQKIQNAGASKFIGFEPVYDKITNYYTVLKDKNDLRTAWDKREVTERQVYMQDLEQLIEISTHRMEILGVGLIEKEFEMRQDAMEHIRLVIDFANSTRGRNHFKNNYLRHIRVRNTFEEVKEEAIDLISEINKEIGNL